MSLDKSPLRKCIGCGKFSKKQELFRVVRIDGAMTIDPSFKAQGRGSYICRNTDCIKKAKKKRSLGRCLRVEDVQEIYDLLLKELEDGQGS